MRAKIKFCMLMNNTQHFIFWFSYYIIYSSRGFLFSISRVISAKMRIYSAFICCNENFNNEKPKIKYPAHTDHLSCVG